MDLRKNKQKIKSTKKSSKYRKNIRMLSPILSFKNQFATIANIKRKVGSRIRHLTLMQMKRKKLKKSRVVSLL